MRTAYWPLRPRTYSVPDVAVPSALIVKMFAGPIEGRLHRSRPGRRHRVHARRQPEVNAGKLVAAGARTDQAADRCPLESRRSAPRCRCRPRMARTCSPPRPPRISARPHSRSPDRVDPCEPIRPATYRAATAVRISSIALLDRSAIASPPTVDEHGEGKQHFEHRDAALPPRPVAATSGASETGGPAQRTGRRLASCGLKAASRRHPAARPFLPRP